MDRQQGGLRRVTTSCLLGDEFALQQRKRWWNIVCGVVLACGLATFGTVWSASSAEADSQPVAIGHEATELTQYLVLTDTGQMWFGKPIYQVENRSGSTLSHVVLKSLSGESLPVLDVGQSTPRAWPTRSSQIRSAPFTLQAGQSMWFVGPKNPPVQFELLWLASGKHPRFDIIETR